VLTFWRYVGRRVTRPGHAVVHFLWSWHPVEPAGGLPDDPVPVNGHPQLQTGVTGIVFWSRPYAQPVRPAVGADADLVEGLLAFGGCGRRMMLEQYQRGPVPAGELGPDGPGRLGDRGRGCGLGDHGQVAGLGTGRPPHPEVSNAVRGRAGSVVPERLVGDLLADRRQAVRRGGRQDFRFLPWTSGAGTSIASLLLPYAYSILARWPGIITHLTVTGCSWRGSAASLNAMPGGGDLTEAHQTAGAAELRAVAGDRGDLLAEEAGIALGTSEDKGPQYRAQAGHRGAVPAGSRRREPDPAWIEEGPRRAEAARLPPFSQPRRSPRLTGQLRRYRFGHARRRSGGDQRGVPPLPTTETCQFSAARPSAGHGPRSLRLSPGSRWPPQWGRYRPTTARPRVGCPQRHVSRDGCGISAAPWPGWTSGSLSRPLWASSWPSWA
jgi:hypothetical protein